MNEYTRRVGICMTSLSLSDTTCLVSSERVHVPSPHDCCVTRSGSAYEKGEFTIPCIGKFIYLSIIPTHIHSREPVVLCNGQ